MKPKLGLLDLRAGVATQGVNGSGEKGAEPEDVSELGRDSCPTIPPFSSFFSTWETLGCDEMHR